MEVLGKIIAIIFLILVVRVAYPHIARGEWIAPTPLPPNSWWLAEAPQYGYLGEPSTGYGWFRFDIWNNPPPTGRPVYRSDFRL